MNKIGLSKIEESLFILNGISANITSLIDFEEAILDKLRDNDKVNQYTYQLYNSLYLLIYHYIKELDIFKSLAKSDNSVKLFFAEIKDDLKVLNNVKHDINTFRNALIGHYGRDKNGNFVHALDFIDKPSTRVEIIFLSEYCLTISYAIGNFFNESLNSALKKTKLFENNAKKQRIVDIGQLENTLITLKVKYETRFKNNTVPNTA